MASQVVTASLPAAVAFATATTRPGIKFNALGVLLSTGSYFVSIDGLQGGAYIPPGVTAMAWPLDFATVTPQITVASAPPGQVPLSPAGTQAPSIVFVDYSPAPNPGVLQTPQTVSNFSLLSIAVAGNSQELIMNIGLARAFTAGLFATGAAPNLTISGTPTVPPGFTGQINGLVYIVSHKIPNANPAFIFACGQGTVQTQGFTSVLAGFDGSGAGTGVPVAIPQTLPIFPTLSFLTDAGQNDQFAAVGSIFY